MINKKSQTLSLAIITAIFLLIIGLATINFIKDEVTDARNNLNCASADDITDGTKLLCLVIDVTVLYWIWIIFSVSIGGIIARFVFK